MDHGQIEEALLTKSAVRLYEFQYGRRNVAMRRYYNALLAGGGDDDARAALLAGSERGNPLMKLRKKSKKGFGLKEAARTAASAAAVVTAVAVGATAQQAVVGGRKGVAELGNGVVELGKLGIDGIGNIAQADVVGLGETANQAMEVLGLRDKPDLNKLGRLKVRLKKYADQIENPKLEQEDTDTVIRNLERDLPETLRMATSLINAGLKEQMKHHSRRSHAWEVKLVSARKLKAELNKAAKEPYAVLCNEVLQATNNYGAEKQIYKTIIDGYVSTELEDLTLTANIEILKRHKAALATKLRNWFIHRVTSVRGSIGVPLGLLEKDTEGNILGAFNTVIEKRTASGIFIISVYSNKKLKKIHKLTQRMKIYELDEARNKELNTRALDEIKKLNEEHEHDLCKLKSYIGQRDLFNDLTKGYLEQGYLAKGLHLAKSTLKFLNPKARKNVVKEPRIIELQDNKLWNASTPINDSRLDKIKAESVRSAFEEHIKIINKQVIDLVNETATATENAITQRTKLAADTAATAETGEDKANA